MRNLCLHQEALPGHQDMWEFKMKNNIIKTKAYLQITILIVSLFIFLFLLSDFALVSAQQADYCCEKTDYGAWCMNAPEENCDDNYRKTPTSCDATSFCRQGCCYESQEGL